VNGIVRPESLPHSVSSAIGARLSTRKYLPIQIIWVGVFKWVQPKAVDIRRRRSFHYSPGWSVAPLRRRSRSRGISLHIYSTSPRQNVSSQPLSTKHPHTALTPRREPSSPQSQFHLAFFPASSRRGPDASAFVIAPQ
jgi:hypothetical protein